MIGGIDNPNYGSGPGTSNDAFSNPTYADAPGQSNGSFDNPNYGKLYTYGLIP